MSPHASRLSRSSAFSRYSAVKVSGRGQTPAALGDLARDRVQRLRLGFDERADGCVALGHPRAFVEQGGDAAEGRQIDLDRHAAERLEVLDGLPEVRRAFGVSVELELAAARHPEAKRRRPSEVVAGGRHGARVRVQWIGPLRGGQHDRGVRCRQREHRHHVERAASWHHPGGRDAPEAGLEADQVVEGRRHAARAGGVGAERKARETQCHRHGRGPTTNRPTRTPGRWRCGRRRTASARRPARWRTGRGWSCRPAMAPASISRCTTVAD